MLGNFLYAGYLDKPNWGIHFIQGKHEPIISAESYHKNQQRLKGKAKAPVCKDISEDFPLRGFVNCGACGSHMSSCWTKGRSSKYPYYICITKSCGQYKKSIKRDVMENSYLKMAGVTGFEPATSAVTGQRSNQLSYTP